MSERKYRDDEVRRIFELAASPRTTEAPARSATSGLTLAELQSIAREVGLEPALVARAAAALDAAPVNAARRTFLGMPIGVGRIVPLTRAPTDREWEELVTDLRTTFSARGRLTTHGGLREWTNGNLHACVELSEGGYRLRLGTLKSDATALNAVGATGLVTGAITFGALLIAGGLQDAVSVPAVFSAVGTGALLSNMVRLPRWAAKREQQMDHIANRIRSIMDRADSGTPVITQSRSTDHGEEETDVGTRSTEA